MFSLMRLYDLTVWSSGIVPCCAYMFYTVQYSLLVNAPTIILLSDTENLPIILKPYSPTSVSPNLMTLQQVVVTLSVFPNCWLFLQQLNLMFTTLLMLFPFRTEQAVVLQWRIYWPLLAGTCSPLECWSADRLTINSLFEFSVWVEQHFIWEIDGSLLCCREQSLDVQSFKHWNPQDRIQRHYLFTLVFLCSCGAEMWWALVCVSVTVNF